MNTETVKQEITNILSTVSQPSRKQYPVAKHQIATLTELGLIELMPVGFGYTDAATVISAAQDAGGKQIGEGDTATSSEASVLFQLLNAVEIPVSPTVQTPKMSFKDWEKIQLINININILKKDLKRYGHRGFVVREEIQHGLILLDYEKYQILKKYGMA